MVRLTAFCASVIGLVVVIDVFMAVSVVVPAVVFLVVSALVSVGVSAITVSVLPSVSSRKLYNTILEHLFAFISDCR